MGGGGEVLKITLNRDINITPHNVSYDPLQNPSRIPDDMNRNIGLYTTWRSRMTVRNADPTPTPIHILFLEFISQIKSILKSQSLVPEWTGVFGDLV